MTSKSNLTKGKETILIVDDEPVNLQFLSDGLINEGYAVHYSMDGQSAIRVAQEISPDLILLDIMLPDMDGYTVGQQLKAVEKTRQTPIIFTSALHQTFDKIKAFEVGGVDYITKPAEIGEILMRIKTHLSLHQLQKQLEAQNIQLQQEIGERERAEEALRQSEERYRIISEAISNIAYVYSVDENGNFRRDWATEETAENITGFTYSEIDDRGGWLSMIYPDDLSQVLQHDDVLRAGQASVVEYRIKTKAGEIRWMRDFALPVLVGDQQKVYYIYGGCQDVTERKHLEEQLHHSQKMEAIGHLAGGVAHHFNNLLTTIIGYVDLSLRALPAEHPVANDLQIVKRTARRAADLTRQLLAFTRKQGIDPQVINLNDAVLNTKGMLRQLISEKVELKTVLAPDLANVKMDASQFEQLLVNFVVNARDAMPNGGQLTIETKNTLIDVTNTLHHPEIPVGHYAQLIVTDTGVGMTEEIKAHIFEPFFTTKEVGQGTGLGLSTCFGIVKQHQGYITVESEPEQGTTFSVYLPCFEEMTTVFNPDSNFELPRGNETILLVEDEATVRELAVRVLRQQGYTVLEATNGADALQAIEAEPADEVHLLLADVVMPKMGGVELASQLVTRYPQLRILLISGYNDAVVEQQKNSLERDILFLLKPFTPARLIQSVRRALDAP